jgi:hypothetical protein
MRIVKIHWTDAVTSAEPGWTTKDEAMASAICEPPSMTSVGFVLHENNKWISISDSIGDDEFGQVTKIPKVMIMSLVDLTEDEKRDETINIFNPNNYDA